MTWGFELVVKLEPPASKWVRTHDGRLDMKQRIDTFE